MFKNTINHIDHVVSGVEMPEVSVDSAGNITGDVCDVTITISILFC